MKYLKMKNGTLYAYDEEVTGFTFIFKEGKWRVAEVVYGILLREERTEQLTEEEVNKLTNGAKINDISKKVRSILDTTI